MTKQHDNERWIFKFLRKWLSGFIRGFKRPIEPYKGNDNLSTEFQVYLKEAIELRREVDNELMEV
ncbi:MAG: hypothetical protein ACFFB2_07975 [Promethearchaeota archaeon]